MQAEDTAIEVGYVVETGENGVRLGAAATRVGDGSDMGRYLIAGASAWHVTFKFILFGR